tara:strand:+ start:265 stop:723 length:459 start_codon:yes stop_codon:yes gene_type:complete
MAHYFAHQADSPDATRVHAGAVVAVYHSDRLLLDHRRDGSWGLIGGALEIGESVQQCGRREVLEETGLEIAELQLVGIFSAPDRKIHRNGEVVQLLTTCFAAQAPHTEIEISHESKDARFFSIDQLSTLDIVETHQAIIPYLFSSNKWPVIL